MEKNNNNIVWKILIALSVLFFGVFLYLYLLRNRKQSYTIVSDNTNDQERLSNDWQNVFQDLETALQKT